jgi:hypothetical protein
MVAHLSRDGGRAGLLTGLAILLSSCSSIERHERSLDLRIAMSIARQPVHVTLAQYLPNDPNLITALALLRAQGIRCGALCSVTCELIVFTDGAARAVAILKAEPKVARSLLFQEKWRADNDPASDSK